MKPFSRKPKIFIGSTSEAIDYAEALTSLFSHDSVDIVTWNLHFEDGFDSTISQLIDIEKYDFGIMIFTPDDRTESRGKTYDAPRDNVIFELGLLIGILGKERVFPIIPKSSDIKLPSDLIGTSPLRFEYNKDKWVELNERKISLQNAYSYIKDKFHTYGIRNSIQIHPEFLLNRDEDKILFKVAFTGPNSMINIKFSAHLIAINEASDRKLSRIWEELKLTTEVAPEIEYSWSFSHRFIFESEIHNDNETSIKLVKSPLLDICSEKYKIEIDKLKTLQNYRIRLDVLAFDSANMKPIHAKRKFEFVNLRQGKFKRFYIIKSDGEIDENSVDWKKFNQIEELTPSNNI